MYIKSPIFWFLPKLPIYAYPLLLFSWIWRVITRLKRYKEKQTAFRSSIPVLCCGGITVGGSGKTILCQDIVQELKKNGEKPHIVMRGYKSTTKSNRYVDIQKDTFYTVGDEALLLAHYCPVCIGKNREISARLAEKNGASCIIMDDGLQNFTLQKNYSLLVIDNHYGLGNGHLLPAGPLREEPQILYRHIDGVIIVKSSPKRGKYTPPSCIPTFSVTLRQKIPHKLYGQSIVAFCGIGHNDKFFNNLKSNGLKLTKCFSFPDHYPYSIKEITKMLTWARTENSQLVTTQKDYMRIPTKLCKHIIPIDISLDWDSSFDKKNILKKLMSSKI